MPKEEKNKKSTQHLQALNQEANQITRESLETALLFLLQKKELAKISISELVEKAGVSRNAFYRNYQSKEQMLEEMFDKVVRRIFKEVNDHHKKNGNAGWLSLFQAAKQEASLLQLAFKHNFEKMLSHKVSEFLNKHQEKDGHDVNTYENSFWGSATVSMLVKWASDGMKVSEEKMANLDLPFFNRKKNHTDSAE